MPQPPTELGRTAVTTYRSRRWMATWFAEPPTNQSALEVAKEGCRQQGTVLERDSVKTGSVDRFTESGRHYLEYYVIWHAFEYVEDRHRERVAASPTRDGVLQIVDYYL